jgi:hypothetical protein
MQAANIKSLLKEHCEAQDFKVLFLPKLHCELNFFKQRLGNGQASLSSSIPTHEELITKRH